MTGPNGKRDLGAWLIGISVALAALVFLVYPLVNALLMSFVGNGKPLSPSNLTFANFERFFTSRSYQRALTNSILSSVLATLVATVLAVPMAFAISRVRIAGRQLILALSVIPLIAPPFIGAYAWIMLCHP